MVEGLACFRVGIREFLKGIYWKNRKTRFKKAGLFGLGDLFAV